MNKKILFLAHSQSIHTQRWVNYFIKQGWDVHICSFHPKKIPGTTHHFFDVGSIKTTGNNFRYFLKTPQIISLIRKLNPAIINSHFLSSFGLLAYLSNINRHIVSLQGTDILINARKNKFRRWIFKKVLDDSLHIFSVSDEISAVLKNEFEQPNEKITTIQYGVNTEIFSMNSSWSGRKYDFITNRSFIENSNYDYLLSVFGEIKESIPNIKIRIAGSGPLKNKIIQWIDSNGLEKNVFFSDAVNELEMAELLNSSRFFLSFTSSDGTPLSLFEAAACGCYPILSDNASNVEWTKSGLNASTINLKQIPEAVDTIKKLISTGITESAIENNLSFVNERMNYVKNMAKAEQVFRTLTE